MGHRKLWLFRAGVEHLGQRVMFALGDGKVLGGLDGDSVDSVLAPVGPVFMCSLPFVQSGNCTTVGGIAPTGPACGEVTGRRRC